MLQRPWVAFGSVLLALLSGCSTSTGEDSNAPASGHAGPAKGSSPGGKLDIGTSDGEDSAASGSNAPSPVIGTVPGTPGASQGAPAAADPDLALGVAGAAANVDPADPTHLLPTNPFVITAHDPLSTFAADVDTASYDIFTSSIANGRLPPAATVRLEEFVNYFHYGYTPPKADAKEPFSIQLAAAPALDGATVLLRVAIQGRVPSAEKRPANLVFLVDTSGSMAAADKLPLVQYTLTQALGALAPTDKISIVSYAGSTEVRLAPTPVAEASKIEAVISGLAPKGGTNGASGIELAYEQARFGFIEGGINHVLLCTDGDFNLGVTSNDALVELIVKERERGVTFTALGYGAAPNDAMMERVSNAGNGTYSVIYSQDAADDYTHERLLSALDYIAKDMKIQVELNPGKVYAYRLLGYEDRDIADKDFRNDVVDAGEVGAGHRVTALYQLVLTGGAIPQATTAPVARDGAPYTGPSEVALDDVALVKVRYKQPDATAGDAAEEVSQQLLASDIADDWSALDADFQWAYAVASFAEIVKRSPYANRAKLDTIAEILARPAHDGVRERETFRASFAKAKPLLR